MGDLQRTQGVCRGRDPGAAGNSANPPLVTPVNFPSWPSWACQGWAEIHDPCERESGGRFCQSGFVWAPMSQLGVRGRGGHLNLGRSSRNIKMKQILPFRIWPPRWPRHLAACLDEAWYIGLAFRRQCRPTNMPGFSRAKGPTATHGREISETFMLLH